MLIGGWLGGVGELDEMGGAWTGVDVTGGVGTDVDNDVDLSSVSWPSFSSFFLRPNIGEYSYYSEKGPDGIQTGELDWYSFNLYLVIIHSHPRIHFSVAVTRTGEHSMSCSWIGMMLPW